MAWHILNNSEFLSVVAFISFVIFIAVTQFLFIFKYFRKKHSDKEYKPVFPHDGKFSKTILVLSVAGFFCILYGYFIEPYDIEISHKQIKSEKLRNPLRIVHFSDTHCDMKKRNEDNLVKIVNELKPDLIFFTGDTLNTPPAIENFKSMMNTLDARLGKYAVNGNYDISFWNQLDLFSKTGFKLLKADVLKLDNLNDKIFISGINMNNGNQFNDVKNKLDNEKFNIFLHHSPFFVESFGEKQPDLYLCGHIHGGQVAMPLYGALITFARYGKKYESGLYEVGKTNLYVNRGIGMEGGDAPRVRFCSRPEITVIDFIPEIRGSFKGMEIKD